MLAAVTRRAATASGRIRMAATLSSSALFGAKKNVSTWANVPLGPPAILGVTEAFKADSFEQKINLGAGTYRDDNGQPYVLPTVRAAERKIFEGKLNKEYIGIAGIPQYTAAAAKLAFGAEPNLLERIAIVQSLGGTGALRIGGAFTRRFYPNAKRIYISNPSWANHRAIFADSGLEVGQYRYYDEKTIGLDFEGLISDIKGAPSSSIFLLHACAHNPTGVDPTVEQWKEIEAAIRAGGHFAFFDMAYQGFATGDLSRDAFAIRYFVEHGHNICVAQSFSKNMGLYGERVGAFSVVCADAEEKKRIESQLKVLIRALYSSPPANGACIASRILEDPEVYEQWLVEVQGLADRIISMRKLLRKRLGELGSKHDWSHLTKQTGMFAFTGLTPEEMKRLATEQHVYGVSSGRISIAGITSSNVTRLAEAIIAVKG